MEKISSAGILYIHLIGIINENDEIEIQQVNSYKNAFNFYQESKKLHSMIQNSNNIELFGVLGLENKINIITNIINKKLNDKNQLDILGIDFIKLIKELNNTNNRNKLLSRRLKTDAWVMDYFWINKEDNNELLIDELIDKWLILENPIIMGKQIMIQSFQFSDLSGRKIIGAYLDSSTAEYIIVLEGGFKLRLNNQLPYVRERVGIKDIDLFTIGDIDTILNNPIYAYGKWYYPTEIYEEWHKVFLYTVALQKQELTTTALVDMYEKFLNFMRKNICDTIEAEPIIEKEKYHEALYLTVTKLKSFLIGKEEPVISKDMWLLLNSRYIYLPYMYELLEDPSKDNKTKFEYEKFNNMLKELAPKDHYQKGIKLEELALYFINNIKGLKISGRRVKTDSQEIDLSAINISLDNNLWELGAYILIECKNWKEKVDIKVIRSLSHISELKGNKTTILFTANGLTKAAEKEIIRTALNGRYIISITKSDLYNIKKREDCYNILIEKWTKLQTEIEDKIII